MMRRLAFGLVLLAACDKPAEPPVALLPVMETRTGPYMVQIPTGLLIDATPVTQEQYQKLMGMNPSKEKLPRAPVGGVQWIDAARFCNRASEDEGLQPCYDPYTWDCDTAANGYRLPTEREWELACRAGGAGVDPSQLGRFAWMRTNSEGRIHPVAQKEPNEWSLYDLQGNVWQWCNDWADGEKKRRVLRGGAWDTVPETMDLSLRKKEYPIYTDSRLGAESNGFRRVRNVPKTSRR